MVVGMVLFATTGSDETDTSKTTKAGDDIMIYLPKTYKYTDTLISRMILRALNGSAIESEQDRQFVVPSSLNDGQNKVFNQNLQFLLQFLRGKDQEIVEFFI